MAYTFFDLQFENRNHGRGVAARIRFPNGYSVSIVKGPGTYGFSENLYEAAVLHDGKLVYDTEATPHGDVVGWLSPGDVTVFLNRVASLPPRS